MSRLLTAVFVIVSCCAASAAQELYDYIVVGGGTAGTALATRLSLGLPEASILLLEAGPAALEEIRINVPGLRGSILGTEYDWNFTTVPQESAGDRVIPINRAKVLGGSSAMNYLCYNRASAAEYDSWGELGSPGWSWGSIFDAMTKSENFTGMDKEIRGQSGPIRNTYNRVLYDVLDTWIPTAENVGVSINDQDYMGGNPLGFSIQGTNIDTANYNRSYSANSYLPLAKDNFVVKTNSQVAKVITEKGEGEKVSAVGVMLMDGTSITATKEVILSAGSIQSPGLLELSGIGQAAVLEAANVTQVLELPGVGENYQDHLRTSNTYRLKDGIESFDALIFEAGGENATQELQKWLEGEVSLYDYTTAAYGFLDWGEVSKDVQDSMIEAAQSGFGASSNVIDKKKLEFLADASVPDIELVFEANYVGAFGYTYGNFITFLSTLMHPMSRGSVHIDPIDPHGKPLIDPNFLNNEYDVRALVEVAKFSRKVANTEPMKSMWETETEPGPDIQTHEQFKQFVVDTVATFYHPVGTCSMLPEKDGGVVDENLVVYGTRNLRVVDNSIIPIIPSAHIQTAAYCIAEMAANLIINSA